MKKKLLCLMLTICMLTGCGSKKEAETVDETVTEIELTVSEIETQTEIVSETEIESSLTTEKSTETNETVEIDLTIDELNTLINELLDSESGYKMICDHKTVMDTLDNIEPDIGDEQSDIIGDNLLSIDDLETIISDSNYEDDSLAVTIKVQGDKFNMESDTGLSEWQSGNDIYFKNTDTSYLKSRKVIMTEGSMTLRVGADKEALKSDILKSIGDIRVAERLVDNKFAFSSVIKDSDKKDAIALGIVELNNDKSLKELTISYLAYENSIIVTAHISKLDENLEIPEEVIKTAADASYESDDELIESLTDEMMEVMLDTGTYELMTVLFNAE